jgi:hypothetical protein
MAYQGLAYELANVMPLARASGLFVALCSAYAPTGALGPSGAPTGAYGPVSGLQSIPCTSAPTSGIRVTATEQKSAKQVLALRFNHVLLDGFFPQFPPGTDSGWQVQIVDAAGNGPTYDLLGAEADSQTLMTRLSVRIAAV